MKEEFADYNMTYSIGALAGGSTLKGRFSGVAGWRSLAMLQVGRSPSMSFRDWAAGLSVQVKLLRESSCLYFSLLVA